MDIQQIQFDRLASDTEILPLDVTQDSANSNADSNSEVHVSNESLFSENMNILRIDFNAPEFKVDHITMIGKNMNNCPQYSLDKKKIYYLAISEGVKVYDVKSHKESTFEIPKAIDRKKFLLLKPILNETIYVGRDKGHKEQLMYYNIDNPKEITREISAVKCDLYQSVEIWGQFSDGSKILYRCSGRDRTVYLKDLNNFEAEDLAIFEIETHKTSIAISPDNRTIISCNPGSENCSLFNISDPLDVTKQEIPSQIGRHLFIYIEFSNDMKTLYLLGSNGLKDGDFDLIRLNYEEILNSPGKASYQIGEVIPIQKPEKYEEKKLSYLR